MTSGRPPDGARIGFLDTARALLLLLGIPFHASEIYRLSGGWLIASPDASFAATALGCTIHVFRMPAFFVLAGLFAAMLLARRGDRAWLVERCRRLGVPLVFSTLAFGWLEQAIARGHRVYLVHEVFVLALGAFLTSVTLAPMLEIGLIGIASLALSLMVFEAVRRSSTASLLLNGR